MDVFEYIYDQNPDAAIALCQSYNMDVRSDADTITALREISVNGGNQGFADVLSLHPEREVIIENFSAPAGYNKCRNGGAAGNCEDCNLSRLLLKSYNASGTGSTMQPYGNQGNNNQGNNANLSAALMQTNTLIFIGILSLIGMGIYIHSRKN